MPMDTRSSLVDAAAALLVEGGPDAVTLRAVGARAGLSRAAPYRHFDGKEDLLAAVADTARADLLEAVLRAVRRAPPGRTRLLRASLAYLRFAADEPHRYGIAHSATGGQTALNELRSGLTTLVREAAPDAEEPERVADLVLSTLHGAATLAAAGHLATPEDGVRELIARLTASPTG